MKINQNLKMDNLTLVRRIGRTHNLRSRNPRSIQLKLLAHFVSLNKFMNNTMEFLVTKDNSYERVDIYLSKKITHLTRSYIKKLIEKGLFKLTKAIMRPQLRLNLKMKLK